ncbi:Ion-translocating oxidoreductase complex subunit G [subsurface metagenome]
MFVITLVFISLASGIYLSTKDLVILNESLFQKKAVLYAADIAIPETAGEIEKVYQERITEYYADDDAEISFFGAKDQSGFPSGWVVFASGPGLWGEIVAAVGFDKNLHTLTGLEFVKQNETPGLGARITEDWFKDQFRGKKPPLKMVPEGSASESNEVDAITGATRTSNAVLRIVHKASDEVERAVGEGR